MLIAADIPKVKTAKHAECLSDEQAFDVIAGFLESERNKESAAGLTGEVLSASSFFQTWCDLRVACNSMLPKEDNDRQFVQPWQTGEEMEDIVMDEEPSEEAEQVAEEEAIEQVVEQDAAEPEAVKPEIAVQDAAEPEAVEPDAAEGSPDSEEKRKKSKKEAKKKRKSAKHAKKEPKRMKKEKA